MLNSSYMLPSDVYSFIRFGYGILMTVQFLLMVPYGRVYFTSEKYGGCLPSHPFFDRFMKPSGYWILKIFWITSALCIAFDIAALPLALINSALCYTFFIHLRWATPMRGMGAPGYMSNWMALFVLLMEYARHFGDIDGKLTNLIVFAFRWDFAIMMLDSGVNKIFHGYPQNKGMNFGMVNPAWGYWPNLFKALPSEHWIFKFCNFSAIFFQILGALLLFLPQTYWLGAVIIAFSFVVVHLLIRLGVLCNLIIVCTLIYSRAGDLAHQLIKDHFITFSNMAPQPLPVLNGLLAGLIWGFIVLLPLVKTGMYINFYAKRRLPEFIQKLMEKYTNALGIIIWRVFTIELIDYFIRIYFECKKTGKRTLHTRFGHRQLLGNNRFLWVGESIMSVIVFNSARYFPQTELFKNRLARYANTFPAEAGSCIVFEWVTISTAKGVYEYFPTKEFVFDPATKVITEKMLNEKIWEEQKSRGFAMHATVKPGTYAPAKPK